MPTVLDGMVRAALLYIRCLVRKYIPALDFVMIIVLHLLSWLWQLSNGIIRFIVACAMLVLDLVFLFAGGGNLCSTPCVIFNAVGDVFSAFFAIFTQRVIITASKRDYVVDTPDLVKQAANGVNAMFQPAVQTSHCIDNPIPCFCQLVDMPDACANVNGQVTPQGLTTADVTMYLGDHFNGSSVCDTLIQSSADIEWLDLTAGQRYLYVDCVSKRVLGESLNKQLPFVPVDGFYTLDAIPRIYSYGADSVQRFVRRTFIDSFPEAAPQPERKEREKRVPPTKEELHQEGLRGNWARIIRDHPETYRDVIREHRKIAKRVFLKDKIMKPDNFLFYPVTEASVVWLKVSVHNSDFFPTTC
jgi:hypothetical protein